MKTPNNVAGKLTEEIMVAISKRLHIGMTAMFHPEGTPESLPNDTSTYNKIYEGVYEVLSTHMNDGLNKRYLHSNIPPEEVEAAKAKVTAFLDAFRPGARTGPVLLRDVLEGKG